MAATLLEMAGESERALREVFKKADAPRLVSFSSTPSMPSRQIRPDQMGTDAYKEFSVNF